MNFILTGRENIQWIVLGSIIDSHDGTICIFLCAITFKYNYFLDILLNFPEGRKIGMIHPGFNTSHKLASHDRVKVNLT